MAFPHLKTSAIAVNITTFPTHMEWVPVYLNQCAWMHAAIYFSLAPPPNHLFHRLSKVAWVILVSFPKKCFFLGLVGDSRGLQFVGITTDDASSKDQMDSERFSSHQKLGSKSRGVESTVSGCVSAGGGHRGWLSVTWGIRKGRYPDLCTSNWAGLRYNWQNITT